MSQLMSQADYARYRGVGRPAVSNWKKAGHLVLAEDAGGRVMIDVARTDARINSRIDPMRGRPANAVPAVPAQTLFAPPPQQSDDSVTVSSVRLDLLHEQRTGQALKNAKAAGDLVPLVEGLRRWGEAARLLRERMQSDMRGLSERLANESETRTVMMLLEETVDRVFGAVAAAIEAGDEEDEDGDNEPDAAEAA